MKFTKTLSAVVLSLAIASPALAISAIPDVPSHWPSEGAFEASSVTSEIATKDVLATPAAPMVSTDESADR